MNKIKIKRLMPPEGQGRVNYIRFLFTLITLFLLPNIICGNVFSDNGQLENNLEQLSYHKDAGYYNVIIICLDTLRADHLGCYGYFRDTTPNIDKLAQNGILFEWAIAQSSFTLPSHASVFTSCYVRTHKADRIERRLSEKEITLAEVLRENGYKTAAFIYNAPQLNPIYGLDKGFDFYSYGEEKNKRPSFEKTMPAALEWIKRNKTGRFFVFLHSNDIHEPYHSIYENFFDPDYKGRLDNEYFDSSTSFMDNNLTRTPREVKHIISHYDGDIKYADTFIPDLIEGLKEWDLLDKTIIILFSDHGEILADRGMRFCHGFSVHDEEVRVPLIIAHPAIKNSLRINKQVQLIDIMPTIMDFLELKKGDLKMEGRSLVDIIKGEDGDPTDIYAYAECLMGESQKGKAVNHQIMVRTSFWKIISNTWKINKTAGEILPKTIKLHNFAIVSPEGDEFELYDLKNDPKENKNLKGAKYKNIEKELLNKILTFH